jgi:hypothetical protein
MVRHQSALVAMGFVVFMMLYAIGSGIQDMPVIVDHFLAPSPFSVFHVGIIAALLGVVVGTSLHEKYLWLGSVFLAALAVSGFILGSASFESFLPSFIVGVCFWTFSFITTIGFSWFEELKDAKEKGYTLAP